MMDCGPLWIVKLTQQVLTSVFQLQYNSKYEGVSYTVTLSTVC